MGNRCWTSDQLQKRRLQHSPECVFYDQTLESIDHLMVQYPFSKEFWWLFSQEKGFSNLTPIAIGDESIRASWVSFRAKCTTQVGKMQRCGRSRECANCTWLERNNRTFERAATNLQQVVQLAKDELWHVSRQRVEPRE